MNPNPITTQREQARTEAIRAAEWANDLASACDWFVEQLTVLGPSTDARRLIARDLATELRGWATTARSNAAHYQEKANTITAAAPTATSTGAGTAGTSTPIRALAMRGSIMSEPDFRKMGDPLNERLPPKDNLLNRRRRKDLARISGPRTLDGENVCTRCGVPDVHCQCDDRINYDAQFDEGTARDDYDIRPIWATDKLSQIIDQHHAMCAEIDHLRAESAAFRDLAGCCSDCEWEDKEIVHRPMCARWQAYQIAEVTDRIANGGTTCGATWRDTESTGWLWYCSLPVGHTGHHRCIGATW